MMVQMMAFKVHSRTDNGRGSNRDVARHARQAAIKMMGFKVAATAMMMRMVRAAPPTRRSSGGFKINSRLPVDSAGRALLLSTLMMMGMVIEKVLAIKHSIDGGVRNSARGDRGRHAGGVSIMMTKVMMLRASAAGDRLLAAEPPAGKAGLLNWAIDADDV